MDAKPLPETPTTPSQDERIMAALSHLTVLLPMVGAIAPIVLWATQKDKSRFVAFQALQAAVYQLAVILLWFLGMGCYVLSFFSMFLGMSFSSPNLGPGEGLMILPFFVIFGLMLVMLLWVIYGLVAAAMVFRGLDFRYLGIGAWLERSLAERA